MNTPRKTILSASAITAFSLTLALGLSANVDQTSRQQGAPLQGVHMPTQYGTPGERVTDSMDPAALEPQANGSERERSSVRQRQENVREFGRREESRQQSATQRMSQRQAHRASDLLDKRVENSQGERLGTVEDIVIDVESGELEYVVVSAGGVLGVGDELRAVPPSALRTSGEDRVVLNIARDQWEQAPSFERENIQQLSQSRNEIQSFYRQHASASSASQMEYGAPDSSRESSSAHEWGSRSQSRSEVEQELQSSPRANDGPSQNWQRRHQTAEPHRLPGDPAGTPAEPRVMHRSQIDDQARLDLDRRNESTVDMQSEQIEFGARQAEPEPYQYDSRATEWRARAFEEDLRQAGADRDARQQRQIEFGSSREMRAQQDEGPTLRNPRLHYTNRGSERGASPVPLMSATEQRQEVYGAPQREESQTRMKSESTMRETGSAMRAESNLKLGSELLGSDITDRQQENIGEISDFLVDLEQGRVEHMIVTTEAKPQKFAVPLRQIQIDNERVTLQVDRQQLDQAPMYRQQASADSNRIFRYEEQTKQTREFGARPADESRSDLTPPVEEPAETQSSSSATRSSTESSRSTNRETSQAARATPDSTRSTQESAAASSQSSRDTSSASARAQSSDPSESTSEFGARQRDPAEEPKAEAEAKAEASAVTSPEAESGEEASSTSRSTEINP